MTSAVRIVRLKHRGLPLARITLCLVLASCSATAGTQPSESTAMLHAVAEATPVRIAGPFEFPWSIAFLPDSSILVTEQPGRLRLIRREAPPVQLAGVPTVMQKGQGGLLDVALDPSFATNGMLYLSYTHGSEHHSSIRVLRAILDLSANALTHQTVIFESTPLASPEQLGGRLAVTTYGYLFLSLGARWEAKRAQNLADDAGKIIRIRTDGSVPHDNPFISTPGARPDIWSFGHRNPQGLAIDPAGRLWSHEHGPLGGDEMNVILRGRNYGWPVITHGLTYSGEPFGEGTHKAGMEQPVRHWSPAIAPSGLAVQVDGAVTRLWIGALADQSLVLLEMRNGQIFHEWRMHQKTLGRIRDVRIGPDGALYLVTDASRGYLYRLNPALHAETGN